MTGRLSWECAVEIAPGLLRGRTADDLAAEIRGYIDRCLSIRAAGPTAEPLDLNGGDMGRGIRYRDAVGSDDYDGVLSLEYGGDRGAAFVVALDMIETDKRVSVYTGGSDKVFALYGSTGGVNRSVLAYILFRKAKT